MATILDGPALYNVSYGYQTSDSYFQTGDFNSSGQAWSNIIYGSTTTGWGPWAPLGTGTADANPWVTPVIPVVFSPISVAPVVDEDAIEREVAKRLQELGIQSRPAASPPPPPKEAPSIDVDEVPKILPKRIIED